MKESPDPQVFDPRGKVSATARRPAPRVRLGEGMRVAILDNSKWNAGRLLRQISSRLEDRIAAPRLRFYKKETFSRVAAPELLAEIAGTNDVVLTAIGD